MTLLGDMALLSAGGLYQRLGESFGFLCLIFVMLFGALSRQRAGAPLRLGLLVGGSLVLHAVVVVGGLLAPSGVKALYAVLLHRGDNALPEALAFAASWQLLLLLAVTSLGLGIYCGRQRRKRAPKLELCGAIFATTVLPVSVLGRMEGCRRCVAARLLRNRLPRNCELSPCHARTDLAIVSSTSAVRPILRKRGLFLRGNSSVGRAPALQAGCRGFESHFLHRADG